MVGPVSDDTIVPVPLLDRDRVAEAVQRRVRLHLDPVTAKAAAHGLPVELSYPQATAVADVALEALAAAHPLDGRKWLIDANREWRDRADREARKRRALVSLARRELRRWRSLAISAWVWFGILSGQIYLHWPRWSFLAAAAVVPPLTALAERRSARRAGDTEAAL